MKKKTLLLLVALLIVAIFALMLCSCNLFDKDDAQIELQKYQERKNKIQNDSRFSIFDENKINEIVGKYETIADSDEYKNLSDEDKDKLVEKLIVSEVLQEEIKVEQTAQKARQEEVKQQLGSLSTELSDILSNDEQTQTEQVAGVAEAINNVKQELQETINSDSSSPEEIAAAKEQLKQVEAAEQEYAYHATADVVKETVQDSMFSVRNPNMSLIRIKSIYSKAGKAYFNADFIKEEIVNGISIFSEINCHFTIVEYLSGDETYHEILNIISGCSSITLGKECTNFNLKIHEEIFETNSAIKDCLTKKRIYNCEVLSSWETVDSLNPDYIIQSDMFNEKETYLLSYSEKSGKYDCQIIKKICPEFWAQKELEESKQNAEAESSAIEEFAERDQDGNVTGFDWNAYRASKEQDNTNTQTSTETVKEVNKLYDDLELGL